MVSNKPPFSGTRLCINPYWRWDLFAHFQTQEFMFTFMVRILSFLLFTLMILFLLVPTNPTSSSRRNNSCAKRTLKIDQISYAAKVIEHFKLNNAKVARTPLPSGYNPAPNPKITTPQLRSRYQSVIGSLLYIMLGTRPDIAFSVIKMS